MSIFSQLISGKISLSQALTEAEAWLGQTETSIERSIASDPAVQSAVNVAISDGKTALTTAESWAGTAISGGLSAFAGELSVLVGKYVPQLIGSAVGGPLGAAAITAIQALGEVGAAAVQHEVATIITGTQAATVVAPLPQPQAA